MKEKKRFKWILATPEFLTGLFVIGAIAILFYFTIIVNGWELFSGSRSSILKVSFPHASTLAVNDKVKVIGVDMGVVTAIELAPDNNSVLVRIKLHKNIPVYPGYEFSIQSSSVFGGAYINIKPGDASRGPAFPPETILKGIQPIDIITEASELIAAFREDEKYLRKVLIEGGVLDKIKDTLKSMEENVRSFNEICADIKEGKGTLGKLFTDPAFYDNARNSFQELHKLADRLNSFTGKVENGKGILGKIMQDEKLSDSLLSFVRNMDFFMKKVNSEKSSLSRLLADDGRFFEDLSSTMKSLSEISAVLNKGDGTIGKLIKDEALYMELRDTVREVRRAVDDFREMAPVATFGSILLGAL